MNIKGVLNNIFPIDAIRKTPEKRTANASADRDPNQGGGNGANREPHLLSDQELEEVLKYLNSLPGIKEHHLDLQVERKEKRIVVFVKDMTGKIIRRIPDTELWELLKAKQSPSRGNLLNKAL